MACSICSNAFEIVKEVSCNCNSVSGTTPIQANCNSIGDNWGTQVAATESPITGNGLSSSPITLIPGDSEGQILIWNGSAWQISSAVGDNWGTQTAVVNEFLVGSGIISDPLEVSRITKIQDAEYNTVGGYAFTHSFLLPTWNVQYGGGPIANKSLLANFVIRIDILDVVRLIEGAYQLNVFFQAKLVYSLIITEIIEPCTVVGQFTVDQGIEVTDSFYLRGYKETVDTVGQGISSTPYYGKLTSQTFTAPEITITVDDGIACSVGLTYELDKKQIGKYGAQ